MSGRTKMWSGFGFGRQFAYWRSKTGLELFRFAFYVAVPIAASAIYANPERMNKLIMFLKYVEYPQAIPSSAIPIGDEVEKFRSTEKRPKKD